RGIDLGALTPAPEDVSPGAELDPQIDGAHRLLEREGADAGVIRGEGAVLEDRIGEEVSGGHRHLQVVIGERLLELSDNALAIPGRGVDRPQVVVVEVDAVGAELGELLHAAHRRDPLADRLSERIAAGVAEGPETEGELVALLRGEAVHRYSPWPGGCQ